MTEAKALLYRIQRKVDRLNTEHMKAIDIVAACNALTESYHFLFKKAVRDFEKDKEMRYILDPVIVREKEMPVTKLGRVTQIKLPADCYRDVGIRIAVTKRGCGRKDIPLTMLETDDKDKSLDNPFWKTSYAWEQIFGTHANGVLYIYNGTQCKPEGMIIDYIQKVGDIHCPSLVVKPEVYIDWNGKEQTKDQGWLLDDIVGEGINRAALMLTRDIGDTGDFQLQGANNTQTE